MVLEEYRTCYRIKESTEVQGAKSLSSPPSFIAESMFLHFIKMICYIKGLKGKENDCQITKQTIELYLANYALRLS